VYMLWSNCLILSDQSPNRELYYVFIWWLTVRREDWNQFLSLQLAKLMRKEEERMLFPRIAWVCQWYDTTALMCDRWVTSNQCKTSTSWMRPAMLSERIRHVSSRFVWAYFSVWYIYGLLCARWVLSKGKLYKMAAGRICFLVWNAG